MFPKLSFLPLGLLASLTLTSAVPCCQLVPPKQNKSVQSKSSSSSSSGSDAVTVAAYYPGWASDFTPANVSWGKFNSLIFAFAVTTAQAPFYDLLGEEQTLKDFVAAAQQNNVNASLSVGGWTGSQYFSQLVASDNRAAFVSSMAQLATTYQLDGLDFDWEYPTDGGIGCNTNSPDDTANFLEFLKDLRAQVGNKITITAPTSIKPWIGSDGSPMTDVSGFAAVLDNIMIMNYDVWGSWSPTVGPNAPLNDSCATANDQVGSAISAVQSWTAAGMPASQIVLGLAAYGHSFHVDNSAALSGNQLNLYPAFNKALQPLGTGETNTTTYPPDQCGNPGGPGGVFTFADMIDKGYLTSNGTAGAGMDFRFDNCSQTPFVYNPATQVMISYDDAEAWAAKGLFINGQMLKGFAIWDVTGDRDDILIDSIYAAMNIESSC